MNKSSALIPLLLCAFCATAALADDQQVYKWTDIQGVLHYSDKPPRDAIPDVQTMTVQSSPPVDPVKQAQAQAILMASAAAMQQSQDAEALQRLQAAEQEAQYELALAAQQQEQGDAADAASVYLIYVSSPLVPRAYRRNLYRPYRSLGQHAGSGIHAISVRPVRVIPSRT